MNNEPAIPSTCNSTCNCVWLCWSGLVGYDIHEGLVRRLENSTTWLNHWASVSFDASLLVVEIVGGMVSEISIRFLPGTEKIELPQCKVSFLTYSINKFLLSIYYMPHRFVFCAIPLSQSTPCQSLQFPLPLHNPSGHTGSFCYLKGLDLSHMENQVLYPFPWSPW